jgi:hypothetical protein
MRKIIPVLVGLLLLGIPIVQAAAPITKEQLQSMFDSMRRDAPWKVDGPLLWGYYFTNATPEPLKQAAVQLEALGYRVVDISERPSAASSARWWLHVERVETHSVESLLLRNQQLYELAAKWKLSSYDGMDVGPAPPK